MKTLKDTVPFVATHPGEILLDEIKANGYSQVEFAKLIGLNKGQLNEIIKGKRDINAEMSLLLEKVLGIDAEYWLKAQSNYDLDKARIEEKTQAKLEAIEQWKFIIPFIAIKFLKKQKKISGNPLKDIPIIKSIYNVRNFEELANINAQPIYAKFRKSEKLSYSQINIIGWVKLVQYEAKKNVVQEFNYKRKDELVKELKDIFNENKGTISKVSGLLAEYGIKFILQEKGEKTPIDGISFWSNNNPAIGMTIRHKRLDNFAFTLFHELGHLYEHILNNNSTEFIDLTKSKEDTAEEIEADTFALNNLIDKNLWNLFINSNSSFSDDFITKFANEIGVNPAIIRGRLCYEKHLSYKVPTYISNNLN